jgi:hypothetical protein
MGILRKQMSNEISNKLDTVIQLLKRINEKLIIINENITDDYFCFECGDDAFKESNYYMLHHHIWKSIAGDSASGQLCWGCAEKRMGRDFVFDDFTDCPVNHDNPNVQKLKKSCNDIKRNKRKNKKN